MQFPGGIRTDITERAMAALVRADVLKPDEPNQHEHYNRAFSAIYDAMEGNIIEEIDARLVPPSRPQSRVLFPPAQHGNIGHGWISNCSVCVAKGVERKEFK